MAQMETFMKDLSELNAAIESTLIPANFDIVQKYMATQASMTTALNGLAAEYARAYLQVQTLKYDENNDPVDVTAEEALSVPDSVISRYKQSWGNLKNTLESLKSRISGAEITEVAPVLPNRGVIEFEPGSDAISKVFSGQEYSSKVSIFANDSELYVLRNRLATLINSISATGITIPYAFAAIVNLLGSSILIADIVGESASRRISSVSIRAKANSQGIVSITAQTRGRWFYSYIDLSSTASLSSALGSFAQRIANGGSNWTEASGTSTYTVPLTSGTLSNQYDVVVPITSASDCKAFAPGGNVVASVDKVAIDIDLEDLDAALNSL